MQPETRNREVVTRFLDGTHGGDLDVIDATVAEGIVTHGFPGGRNPDSREAYKQFFREFGAAFSDMDYRTLAMLAEGDFVAARFVVSVRHTGAYAGYPPSGRRVTFTGMVLYRLEAGHIVETWLHLDERALLEQIGHTAQPARCA
ncbi:ester cyclase [Spiribacter halobius]|nr:ester cyclase [Spiribacter halobius]UEX79547.1 ester cyclase [Spiribacter halobius]